MDPFSCLGGD